MLSKSEPEAEQNSVFYSVLHVPGGYLAAILGVLVSFVLVMIVPGGGESNTVAGHLIEWPLWGPEMVAGLLLGPLL